MWFGLESELWLLLPVLAAVCVAVGSFLFLQSAVDRRSTVTAAEKADWKRQLVEQSAQVVERARQKVEADKAAIQAHIQQANNDSSTTHDATLREKTEPSQRQSAAATDDSGLASDNDWELVDDERIERAEESEYEPPAEYQHAVEAFIEAMLELPNSQQHTTLYQASTTPQASQYAGAYWLLAVSAV